jgi:cobalt transporter subunit CbtA
MGTGFALMLCGMYALRQPSGAIHGLLWGLAGYVVFFAAPSAGLPPDLPGTAAAELSARQHWWLGAAAATALGLGLIFLQARKLYKMIGILLLAVPHLIGAPHPALPQSLAPETLQTQFRLITIGTNALFWLLLGGLSAAAFRRFPRRLGDR